MTEQGLILFKIHRITSHNIYIVFVEDAYYRFSGTSHLLAFHGIVQAVVLLIHTNFLQ